MTKTFKDLADCVTESERLEVATAILRQIAGFRPPLKRNKSLKGLEEKTILAHMLALHDEVQTVLENPQITSLDSAMLISREQLNTLRSCIMRLDEIAYRSGATIDDLDALQAFVYDADALQEYLHAHIVELHQHRLNFKSELLKINAAQKPYKPQARNSNEAGILDFNECAAKVRSEQARRPAAMPEHPVIIVFINPRTMLKTKKLVMEDQYSRTDRRLREYQALKIALRDFTRALDSALVVLNKSARALPRYAGAKPLRAGISVSAPQPEN